MRGKVQIKIKGIFDFFFLPEQLGPSFPPLLQTDEYSFPFKKK